MQPSDDRGRPVVSATRSRTPSTSRGIRPGPAPNRSASHASTAAPENCALCHNRSSGAASFDYLAGARVQQRRPGEAPTDNQPIQTYFRASAPAGPEAFSLVAPTEMSERVGPILDWQTVPHSPERVIFDQVQWGLPIGPFRLAPRADIPPAPRFMSTRPN
jgi:hypothetical protein